MKKTAILLLSVISLVSGFAQAKSLNPDKKISCGLSSARDLGLRHKKAVVIDGVLFLERSTGEIYKDSRYECQKDDQLLQCSGDTIFLSVNLELGLAQITERAGAGSRGIFNSACENN